MNFNSIDFLIFFPVVCLCYYIIPLKARYLFLLVCSYFFYMCWNPKYAVLLFTSTAITWLSGILLARAGTISEGKKSESARKLVVALSFVSNLAILFFSNILILQSIYLQECLLELGLPFRYRHWMLFFR